MNKTYRWRWFRYAAEDAKAAQAELDRLYTEGWELDEIGIFVAKFCQTSHPRRCWVEPARWGSISSKDEERKTAYLALCEEAGWELLEEAGGLWYFRAQAGADPAPIQTDELVEWENVLRKVLWDRAGSLLWLAIFWTIHFWVNFIWKGFHWWEILLSNASMLLTGVLLLWNLKGVVHGVYVMRYRIRCRRAAKEGKPFPVPGRWGAKIRSCAWLADALFILCFFVLIFSGIGEEKQSGDYNGLLQYETVSVFARHTEYHRFGYTDWLYMDEYNCKYTWLAEIISQDLAEDERDEKKIDLHFHAPTEPQPVQMGFDEAWRYDAGSREGLIFRQGTQVIRVETAEADFTDRESILTMLEGFKSGG